MIASAVKGHVDLIKRAGNGLLCPYGDSAAFARQVRRFLDEPGLRDGMAAQARASVLQYSLERVLPQVWGLSYGLCGPEEPGDTAGIAGYMKIV